MSRRIMRFLAVAATAAALAVPPGAAAQPKGDPIKLGLIDIYSGGFAFIADTIRTGYQIAIDEANAAGGLNGRPFQLVTADMGPSVEKAVTEGRRMILEEKIRYISVGIHSGAAVAVGNLGKEHKALIVGGFATTKRLTAEAGHPYVARANLSTIEIGRVMAEHIKTRPEIKRVATIAPDYEYGQHFTEDFVAAIKLARPDITIVRRELPKLGATDFAPHVTALQSQPVDMIVAGVFGADLVNFLRAGRDFGLFKGKTQLFVHGLDLAKGGAFRDALPEGTLATVWFPFYSLTNPRAKTFADEVEKRMKTYATGPAPVGYTAAKMVIEAMKRAGTDDVDKVRDQLQNVSFEGPTGLIKVRGCDNMALYNFYVGTAVKNPKYPDGIGVEKVQSFNTEAMVRPCVDVLRVRGG